VLALDADDASALQGGAECEHARAGAEVDDRASQVAL